MTTDKAIEILTDFHSNPNAFFTADLPDAIQLGIEALEEKLAREKG